MIIKYILIFIFLSCTDFLLYEENHNSIYLKGEAWVEINNTIDFTDNIFSIELWFSAINSENTQTIISIIDENEKTNFGLFINPEHPKIIQVRHENILVNSIELDNSIYNYLFYYIAVFSNENTSIYINCEKYATIN